MRVKPVISILIAISGFMFIACDDDLNSIGSSIQPGGDDIKLWTDTFDITAKTVMWDSVYARTTEALVGEYKDPIFGRIKSDYLTEFFCPKTIWMSDRLISVDSVFLYVFMNGFVGDSISPMGISAYQVDRKLDRDFYTNVDPADYCDMNTVMGRTAFSVSTLPIIGAENKKPIRAISIPLDTIWGRRLYDEWRTNPSTFANSDTFREFMPGVYVTPTLGDGTLLNAYATRFAMRYTYIGRKTDDSADSIRNDRSFTMDVSPEIIQLNHIENYDMGHLITGATDKAYMKSPAGVYTELTIPLNRIADKIRKDTTVNSANFKLTGYTEEEQFSGFARPSQLLFIHKDSVDSFFKNKQLPDNKSSFIVSYSSSTNTYNFGNLSAMVNYYLEKFREENYATIPDLTFVLMPVDLEQTAKQDYYGNVTYEVSGVRNTMLPTSVILRTDPKYMKMPVIYSKYNDR